jgi:hypothetical protein
MENNLGFPFEVGGLVSKYPTILEPTGGVKPCPSDLSCTPSIVDAPESR